MSTIPKSDLKKADLYIIVIIITLFLGWLLYVMKEISIMPLKELQNEVDSLTIRVSIHEQKLTRDTIIINLNQTLKIDKEKWEK